MSFCTGTLFLSEAKGLVDGSLQASLAASNNFLGVLFFTCMTL